MVAHEDSWDPPIFAAISWRIALYISRSKDRLSDLPDHESPTCDRSIAGGVPSPRDETSPHLPLAARDGTIRVSERTSRVTSLCMDKSRGTWPREGLGSGFAKRDTFVCDLVNSLEVSVGHP